MGPLAILLNFFVFSCGYNIFGVVVSCIVAKTGIAEADAGSLLSVYQAGMIASLALSPLLARRLSSGGLLRLGTAAQAAGFLLLFLLPRKVFVFIAFAVLGLGGFYIDTGSNSRLADNFPERKETLIPLLHFIYSLGALVCGYLVLPFKTPERWRFFYGVAAALMGAALLAGLAGRGARPQTPSKPLSEPRPQTPSQPRPEALSQGCPQTPFQASPEAPPKARPAAESERTEGGHAKALLRDRLFVLYCLLMLCYGAALQTCASWFPLYMEKELLARPILVATANTCLWTGVAVSRLLGSFVLGRGVEPLRFTAWGLLVSFLGQILALSTRDIPFSLAMIALCGFAGGSTIPFFIVETNSWHPGKGKAISIFYMLSLSLGSMIFPYAVTRLSKTLGLRASMAGSSLLFLAGAALAFRMLGRRGKS